MPTSVEDDPDSLEPHADRAMATTTKENEIDFIPKTYRTPRLRVNWSMSRKGKCYSRSIDTAIPGSDTHG